MSGLQETAKPVKTNLVNAQRPGPAGSWPSHIRFWGMASEAVERTRNWRQPLRANFMEL